MVYADTRRPFWNAGFNSLRFFLPAIGCGLLVSSVPNWAMLPMFLCVSFDWFLANRHLKGLERSRELMTGALKRTLLLRLIAGWTAVCLVPFPFVALGLFTLSELASRLLFFRAVDEPGMPGTP